MQIFDKIKTSYIGAKSNFENRRYKKYISNFSSPKNNDTRIARNVKDLVEFDLVDITGKNDFDGSSVKRFVMVDKNKLSEYFEAVKQGDTCYQSYLESADIVSGTIPQNLSVLIKKEGPIRRNAEVIGSRVMKFFEEDTVFNFLIEDPSKVKFTASLDFIKPEEEFITLFDIDCNYSFNRGSKFEDIEASTRKVLKIFARHNHFRLSKQDEDIYVKKLLYSAMIRRFLLGDNDVRSGNFGLLFNEKSKKFRFCPNFDYGCTFSEHPYCKRDLRYLQVKYPDLYERFVSKVKLLGSINKQTGHKLFHDFVYGYVDDEKDFDHFLLKLDTNILNINRAVKEIEREITSQAEK